jgi:hypothetical protein
VIDDLLTLVFFGLILGVLSGGSFEASEIALTLFKVVAFFALAFVLGRHVYPSLTLPFRSEGGKGFTFVLFVAIGAGLVAEAIGLHMILGAYLAGLFFEERVAHPRLVRVVADRSYGIAYSFLGPIFFISLGFSITFDISASGWGFLAALTVAVIVGQVLSAGGMAIRMGLPPREALTVGIGMCGRAELAFILASLALAQGAISPAVFSVLIFTAFLLNLFTPMGLKGCAVLLAGQATRSEGAGVGILWLDKFEGSDGPEMGWSVEGSATSSSRRTRLLRVDSTRGSALSSTRGSPIWNRTCGHWRGRVHWSSMAATTTTCCSRLALERRASRGDAECSGQRQDRTACHGSPASPATARGC